MQGIDHALSIAARAHATAVLGAERSARASSRAGYRSGQRTVPVAGPLGVMNVALVNSRQGLLRPDFLKDAGRFTEGVKQLALRLWTHGLSYRSISSVSPDALKSRAGRSSVGSWVQEGKEAVVAWLQRPIPADIRYLKLDGMFVSKKRVTTRCEPVLVVLGITDAGHKHVLDVLPAPKETSEAWQTSLQRIKGRGLDVSKLRMVISDGCKGIIKRTASCATTSPTPTLYGAQYTQCDANSCALRKV